MTGIRKRLGKVLLAVGAAAATVTLAACGSSEGSTSGPSDATVQQQSISGVGTVLVDSSGKTLYFPEEESSEVIKCVDACAGIWPPLTIASGETPTVGPGVTGELATVERPDGQTQVTYDGHPLYRFGEDSGPGEVNGNGFTDDFNGTTFHWRAATVSGAATGTDEGSGSGYDLGY